MISLRTLLLLVPLALMEVGCGASGNTPAADNVDANVNTVSETPWNKPESWETNGQLGAMGQ